MRRFTLLLIVAFCTAFLAACSTNDTNDTSVPQEQTNVSENEDTAGASTDTNTKPDQEQTGSNESADEETTADYQSYQGNWKLKVGQGEQLYLLTALEDYFGSTGINFDEIDDTFAKGSIYSIQGAPSYRQAIVDFDGKIEDGKLTASYTDEAWEYSGNIEITFEKDQIMADITRDAQEATSLWGIPEGTFTFLRPIETDIMPVSEEETASLESFFLPFTKERIQPFDEGGLTDEMIINFIGINVAASGYDVDVAQGGTISFDRSSMDQLAEYYFGVPVTKHQSYDIITYQDGTYTIPALDGVSDYPSLQFLMKDTQNDGIYYAVVDYMFQAPGSDEPEFQYEYLFKLKDNGQGGYIVKSMQETGL